MPSLTITPPSSTSPAFEATELTALPQASAPTLQEAAARVAGHQQYPAATLYIVATPIGNLADISLRAVHVLALVDAVACEDTRHSGALLQRLGLDKPRLAVHQHNERESAAEVVRRLADGQRVAFVSDAGTPAVSDPGAWLVAAVREAGHRVMPIPGASSALAALSVAGDWAAEGFVFVGFLPARGALRRQALQEAARDPRAQVLFEAPHRIDALAAELADAVAAAAARPTPGAPRTLTVCRELTKQFETVATMPVKALPGWLAENPHRRRGEFVLVLHTLGRPQPAHAFGGDAGGDDALPAAAQQTLATLMEELALKQAVGLAVKLTGAPRNALYQAALKQRDGVA
jgi:16S rRNA (cytidine1402-2'-O)-methyltransferase